MSFDLFLPPFRMGVEGEVDACGQLTMSGSTIGSNTVDIDEDNDYDDEYDDTDENIVNRPNRPLCCLTSGSRG